MSFSVGYVRIQDGDMGASSPPKRGDSSLGQMISPGWQGRNGHMVPSDEPSSVEDAVRRAAPRWHRKGDRSSRLSIDHDMLLSPPNAKCRIAARNSNKQTATGDRGADVSAEWESQPQQGSGSREQLRAAAVGMGMGWDGVGVAFRSMGAAC